MIVTSDTLAAINNGFRALYNRGLAFDPTSQEGRIDISRIAQVIDVTTKQETYVWTGFPAGMSEWVDRRKRKGLATYSYVIENKKYSDVIEIERDAIEDDQLGQFSGIVEMMGVQVRQHPEEIIADLLNDGFTTTGYDNQYFFDTDHSEGDSGTQSNKSTVALTRDNLEAAVLKFMGLVGDNGKPLGVQPDLLLVSKEAYFDARDILNSTSYVGVGGGSNDRLPNYNPFQGFVDLAWSPYLDPDNWYLLATRYPVKPFIFQWRIRPQWQAVTNPNDDAVFETDIFKYGVRARYGAGYSFWQLIHGSTGGS